MCSVKQCCVPVRGTQIYSAQFIDSQNSCGLLCYLENHNTVYRIRIGSIQKPVGIFIVITFAKNQKSMRYISKQATQMRILLCTISSCKDDS